MITCKSLYKDYFKMAIKRLDHVNFITHLRKDTINFYVSVIGLEQGKPHPADTSNSLYFHIPGDIIPILHIGDVST